MTGEMWTPYGYRTVMASEEENMEFVVEKTVCNRAEMAGWLVRKIEYPGRRGALDRMFIKDGRVVFIEFKRPGGVLDPLQEREKERLIRHGAEAYVIDDVEVGLNVLRGMK